MRAAFFFTFVSSAAAQLLQYGQNALPDCARQCATLNQAAQACYPSSPQPVLCLCQSAFLTSLKTTPSGTCDSVCTSAADQQRIFQWYNAQFCSTGGISSAQASLAAATGNAAAAQPTQTQGDTQVTGTSDGSSGSSGSSSASGSSVTTHDEHPSWWSVHARWIAMVIVLVVAFAAIIVIGIFLKKRYIKKRDRTLLNGAPTGWAPRANQHVAGGVSRAGEKSSTQTGQYRPPKATKAKSTLQKMMGR